MRKRTLSVAEWGLVAWLTSGSLVAQDAAPSAPPSARPRPPDRVPITLVILDSPRDAVLPPGPTYRVSARNLSGRVIVAWGARLQARDGQARLRPVRAHVIRPRAAFRSRTALGWLEGFMVPGPSPAYEVRPTFALFDDGSWMGDGALARREIVAMRAEYVAARELGEVLSVLATRPTRDAIARASRDLSRRLARQTTPAAREPFEGALRTLGAVLDERTRMDRTYEQAVSVARDRVDRTLAEVEDLTFVTRPAARGE